MGEGNQVNIDQDHYHDSQWRIQGVGWHGVPVPPLGPNMPFPSTQNSNFIRWKTNK